MGLALINKNYRPLSNLTFLSKLAEKAALQQYTNYVDYNDLLPDYQSAYRRFFSTETALIKLHNDILLNMDKQLITPMVAIDLSAAFDTVDHDILLQVLGKNFGVSGTALSWFDSYLRQRTYQVQINDKLSSVVKLDFSVPQGSCAGPILFTDYASTLASQINDFNIQIMGYADDHSLYDAFPANSRASELTTMNNLQKCLVSVRDWMSRNRLKMNDEKTEFILFGNHVQFK